MEPGSGHSKPLGGGVLGVLEFWGCWDHSVLGPDIEKLSQLHIPVRMAVHGCLHLEY